MTFKFSIVTPSYNCEKYISATIESVISQKGDFSIEYFIVDNCSTDNTYKIIQNYQKKLEKNELEVNCNDIKITAVSMQDNGMYEALKYGFSKATGDIYAWINSDDIYRPGAFEIICKTFRIYPEIQWLKGITSYIDENSDTCIQGECLLFQQEWIREGLYGPVLYFIEQDSVFWRSELWLRSGGVNSALSMAGDYFLWRDFSKYSPLYSINYDVSYFRKRAGQKSENIENYWREIKELGGISRQDRKKLKYIFFRNYYAYKKYLPLFILTFYSRILFRNKIYHLVNIDNDNVPFKITGCYHNLMKLI